MLKIIEHIAKAVIAVVVAILATSCGMEVQGSGNVVTQSRNANENFTSVSGSRGLEVIVEQHAERSITVEADDNLQEHIKTKIEDGTLKISSDVGIRKAGAKRVIVSLPVIESISSSSGATVKSKNTLKGNSMGLSSSSGSHLEVNVDVTELKCESSSGSELKAYGKTEKLEADSSSGSNINTKELVAKNAEADASSGSHIRLNVTGSLTAEASSGGHVYYINTPGTINKSTSSGGQIEQE